MFARQLPKTPGLIAKDHNLVYRRAVAHINPPVNHLYLVGNFDRMGSRREGTTGYRGEQLESPECLRGPGAIVAAILSTALKNESLPVTGPGFARRAVPGSPQSDAHNRRCAGLVGLEILKSLTALFYKRIQSFLCSLSVSISI